MAIDVTSTERALAGSGIVCPPIDKELFAKYTEFFANAGYVPAAQGRRGARSMIASCEVKTTVTVASAS